MEYQGESVERFAGRGKMANAAWDLVLQANPADILKSKPILELVELSDMPSNHLLVKGVVLRGKGHVPLIDTRMPLSVGPDGGKGSAHALIVDVEGVEVGLIVGELMVA